MTALPFSLDLLITSCPELLDNISVVDYGISDYHIVHADISLIIKPVQSCRQIINQCRKADWPQFKHFLQDTLSERYFGLTFRGLHSKCEHLKMWIINGTRPAQNICIRVQRNKLTMTAILKTILRIGQGRGLHMPPIWCVARAIPQVVCNIS